jgi:hypothetical protein
VQQARAGIAPTPDVAAQTVIDPITGLPVPVIPVNEGVVSQPVVEPIANKPGSPSGK